MANSVTDVVRRLLPADVLQVVRSVRRQSRRLIDRLRWLATGRHGDNVGVGWFDGHRMAYRFGSVDTDVLRHSFTRDIFFAAIPEYVLPENGVVVDIGAHIGTFSLLAAKKAPIGRIFAIEASRETFDLLRANVELSRRANIHVDHLAIAGQNGLVQLHHDPEGNYGHSITKSLSNTSESVEAVTLADYLEGRGITSVDLMKFNCEGAEFPILLASSAGVLRRINKMIVLYHCDLVEESAGKLVDHLNASGFATRLTNQTADRGWIIATRRESA